MISVRLSSRGAGVAVGRRVGVGRGLGVAVGRLVGVGCGVAVGAGVAVGTGVAVGAGCGVWVGAGVTVEAGSGLGAVAGAMVGGGMGVAVGAGLSASQAIGNASSRISRMGMAAIFTGRYPDVPGDGGRGFFYFPNISDQFCPVWGGWVGLGKLAIARYSRIGFWEGKEGYHLGKQGGRPHPNPPPPGEGIFKVWGGWGSLGLGWLGGGNMAL